MEEAARSMKANVVKFEHGRCILTAVSTRVECCIYALQADMKDTDWKHKENQDLQQRIRM
jgi:hypothetical protein